MPPMLTPEQLAAAGMLPPPGPPPPTPASAGFAAYIADPQNAQTIANSLIKPGQPIQSPAAPQAYAQSQQMPTQSPQEVAAPPSLPPTVAAPPDARWNPVATPAPPPSAAPAPPVMGGGVPQIAPPAPQVATNQDATAAGWAAAHPELAAKPQWKHQEGGGWRGALKDIGGLAVAGLQGVGGGINHDPGAGVRWVGQQQDYDRSVPDINQARWRSAVIQPQLDALNIQKTGAGIDQTKATTAYTQRRGDIADDKNAILRAQHGLKIDPTTGEITDDTDSQAFKDRQGLAALRAAQADRDRIQAENANSKYKPGTPQYEEWHRRALQADQRLANQGAALGLRSQGLQLRKNDQNANFYGMGPDGKPLPNAPVFENDEGDSVVGGLKGAKSAITQQAKVGQFKDLGGSIKHAQSALEELHKDGGSLSDPVVVSAMSDPHSTIGKIVNGKLVKGNLNDTQVKAIGALRQLQEQAGIFRSSTGGSASEAQAQRILETLPVGGDTPETARNKFQELQGVYNRLTPSVVRTSGGLSISGKGSPSPSSPHVRKYNSATGRLE